MAVNGKILAAVIVAAIVIVAAVAVVAMTPPSTKTGTISIYVKDDPALWSHVNVTFSEVKVHSDSGDNESGWQTLSIKNGTIDLRALVNISELLASAEVSAGKYTQIRIVVTSVMATMTNGTIVNMTVPSGELKTTHPFNVTAGATSRLTLEIDLERSIVQNGSGWIFTPVLGAVQDNGSDN